MIALILTLCCLAPGQALSAQQREAPARQEAPAEQKTPAWMPGGQPQAASTLEAPPPPGYPAADAAGQSPARQSVAPSKAPSKADNLLSGLGASWGGYLEALALICFALAILLCVLWLFKRLTSGVAFFKAQAVAPLRIENRLALAPKKWIFIVQADGKRLVLGVTDQTISLLSSSALPASEQAAPLAVPRAPARAAPASPAAAPGVSQATRDQEEHPEDIFAGLLEKSKEGKE